MTAPFRSSVPDAVPLRAIVAMVASQDNVLIDTAFSVPMSATLDNGFTVAMITNAAIKMTTSKTIVLLLIRMHPMGMIGVEGHKH